MAQLIDCIAAADFQKSSAKCDTEDFYIRRLLTRSFAAILGKPFIKRKPPGFMLRFCCAAKSVIIRK